MYSGLKTVNRLLQQDLRFLVMLMKIQVFWDTSSCWPVN